MNAVDAVCVKRLGQRNASSSHGDVLRLVADLDVASSVKRRIDRHFKVMLSLRYTAAYTWEPSTDNDARRALEHMDRLMDAIRPLVEGR